MTIAADSNSDAAGSVNPLDWLSAASETASNGSAGNEVGELTRTLKDEARRIGFELVGVAPAVSPPGLPKLHEWLAAGFAGEMQYLPRRAAAYEHPRHVSASVRSVVMLAMNYRTEEPQPAEANEGREPGMRGGRRTITTCCANGSGN